MAWNDPGGDKDKDPWTGSNKKGPDKGPEQGPPDLDEAWRNFSRKLKSALGRRARKTSKGGGGPDQPNLEGYGLLAGLIGAALFVLWLLSGIFIVAPAEKAVILRFGRYVSTMGPGPHWIPPIIDKKYVVNVGKVDNFSYGGAADPIHMLTKDENIVNVSVAVQFRVKNPKDYLFNVVNPNASLQQATASALRQVIGQSSLDDVLTVGRALIRQQVSEQLNSILELYHTGIEVTNVSMQPAAAPEEVKDKFDEAIRAQEDEQRFINQAEAYARSVTPIAEGRAKRYVQEANGYKQQVILRAAGDTARYLALLPEYGKAPQVMRNRLYLDTMEAVFKHVSKVVVDTQSGSLMYLPIQQMLEAQALQGKTPLLRTLQDAKLERSMEGMGDGLGSGFVNGNLSSTASSLSASVPSAVPTEGLSRDQVQRTGRQESRGRRDL